MPHEKKLTPEQEAELTHKYADGAPVTALAAEYGVATLTVTRAIRRNGGTVRPKSPRITTDEQDRQIADLYAQGVKTSQLAAQFGVHVNHVAKAVRRNGGEVRRKGPNRLSEDQERELLELYESGMGTKELAARFGIYTSTVVRVVKRLQGGVKPKWRKAPREFSPEQIAEMARLWADGKSQAAIAAEIGTTALIVSRVLRQAGVESHPGKRRAVRGEAHGKWNGGRVTAPGGYIAVLCDPDDPLAVMRNRTGYILEHRLVMAEVLGRPLADHETVHHINGDRTDNAIENLQLRQGRHGKGVVATCLDCGSHNIGTVPIASHSVEDGRRGDWRQAEGALRDASSAEPSELTIRRLRDA